MVPHWVILQYALKGLKAQTHFFYFFVIFDISCESHHMTPQERTDLYISLAQGLEQQGKLADAEQLYLFVNEYNQAINMYRKRHPQDTLSERMPCSMPSATPAT